MPASPTNTASITPGATADAPWLDEFPPVSLEEWKALVETELKGESFEKRMFSTTYEGITLRPVYRAEDISSIPHTSALPGFAPFVRGTRAGGHVAHSWEVSQELVAADPADFNVIARASLARGLTALNIVLDRATRNGADPDWTDPVEVGAGGLSLAVLGDLETALEGIDLAAVSLFFRSGASGMPLAAMLVAMGRKLGLDLRPLRGCIEIDPLGVLSHEGQLPQSLEAAYREMAALTSWAARHAPRMQTVCVHGRAWHEAGGNAVQELAFTLATVLEYLRALQGRGLGVDLVAPRMRLAFTVGTRFFMEIAKLRAARMLWARLFSAAGGSEESQRASVHVRTSHYNKTLFDPHSNLLRTTVEAMAAVLGGCDSLQVGTFDEVVRPADDVSRRIACNQQLVLRDECHLTRAVDPAGGSWLVESLTDDLARRAWALFQEVERRGGMAQALKDGFPQSEVSRVAKERFANLARRRDRVVGTNVYAWVAEEPLEAPVTDVDNSAIRRRRAQRIADRRILADDRRNQEVLDRLDAIVGKEGEALFEASVEAVMAGATLREISGAVRVNDRPDPPITAVCLTRATTGFERLRRAVDDHAVKSGRRLKVFLAIMGPPKQHRARSEFSRDFLEVAGFDVVVPPNGFSTPDQAARAAGTAGSDAVCICSTDETYGALVPEVVKAVRAVRADVLVVLAGCPPGQVEAFKAAGVDAFIHARADALDVLTTIGSRLGVPVPA